MAYGVFDDLTRRRFGRLLVIWRDDNKLHPSGQVSTMWLCRCDCGKVVSARADALKRGEHRSCGCLRTDLIRERRQFFVQYRKWTPAASEVLANLAAREREWQEWLSDDGRVETVETGGARVLPLRAPAIPRQDANVPDGFRRDCRALRESEEGVDRAVGG